MKRMGKLVFLILSAVVVLMACGKNSKQEAAEQLELGQRYLTEGNYGEAIVAFNKAIELEPNEIQAYTGVITAYIEAGREGEATAIIEKALEQFGQPDNQVEEAEWGAFVEVTGRYYKTTENYGAAIETLDRVIKMSPAAKEGYIQLIEIYEKLEDYEKAIEISEEGYRQTQNSDFEQEAEKYRKELEEIQEQERIRQLEEEQKQKEKEKEEIERLAMEQGQELFYVSDGDELRKILEEYKSNIYIILEGKSYFTTWLLIQGSENVTIQGMKGTRILCSSGSDAIFLIKNSKNITLKGLVLGHASNSGSYETCSAGVIESWKSEVNLIECDIFGCGVYGIGGQESTINVVDTTIRDCSLNIMIFNDSIGSFQYCSFLRNGYKKPSTYAISTDGGNDTILRFSECIFSDNKNPNCIEDGADYTFDSCTFYGNGWGGDNVSSAPELLGKEGGDN